MGDVACIKKLIEEAGCSVDASNLNGITPLLIVEQRDPKVQQAFINSIRNIQESKENASKPDIENGPKKPLDLAGMLRRKSFSKYLPGLET